jgi:hypothetical protein
LDGVTTIIGELTVGIVGDSLIGENTRVDDICLIDVGIKVIVADGVEISKVLDELEEARCVGGTPHSLTNF